MSATTIILIGNAISFVGACIMVATGFIKKKENVLIAQCAQFGIMGIGNLVLGGFTGLISNLVSILRNFVCLKREFTLPFKIVFIAIQIVLAAIFNNMGLIGWLPVIAACLFTWFLDVKSDLGIKFVIIGAELLWIVYDITLMNFTSMTFDILTIISSVVGIVRIKKAAA